MSSDKQRTAEPGVEVFIKEGCKSGDRAELGLVKVSPFTEPPLLQENRLNEQEQEHTKTRLLRRLQTQTLHR